MSLSQSGTYFFEHIVPALNRIEETCNSLGNADFKRDSTINCVHNIPLGNIGAIIKHFRDSHPEMTIRFGDKQSTMFQNETVDITLLGSSIKLDGPDVVMLGHERYVVIVPPDHRFAHRRSIDLSDLADDYFAFTEPSELCSNTMGMCHAAGFEPDVAFQSQTMNEIVDFVGSGLGVAIAAEFTWLYKNDANVVILPIKNSTRGRYLYAKLPKDGTPSEATWTFIDFLRAFAKEVSL